MHKRGALLIASITLLTAGLMHAAVVTSVTTTATPAVATTSASITYTKGTPATLGTAQVKILPAYSVAPFTPAPTGSLYYTITGMPAWLQVDHPTGTATAAAPVTVTFSATPYAANLDPGTIATTAGTIVITGTYYPTAGAPGVTGSGLTDSLFTVSLTVSSASQLTAVLTASPSFSWNAGSAYPSATLLVTSSGDPVNFSVAASSIAPASPAWILPAVTTSIAYNWGSSVTIGFLQSVFDAALPGSALTGTITVTPISSAGVANTAAAIVIKVAFQIGSPNPIITSLTPSTVPKIIPPDTTRTIAVVGTGFVAGMPVTVGTHANLFNDCVDFPSAITEALCIENSTTMFVKVTATDLGGIANAGTLSINAGATGTLNLTISTAPILATNGVVDAAALTNLSSPVVSPYEIISIFGDNFLGNTVFGALAHNRYPNSLTDNLGNTLTVTFTTTAETGGTTCGTSIATGDAQAYLLMATTNQINLIVPSTITSAMNPLRACIMYNGAAKDTPILASATATPGIFTLDGGGAGQSVLTNNFDNSVNSKANVIQAYTPTNGTKAWYFTLYVSGLGLPSTGGETNLAVPVGTVSTQPGICANVLALRTGEDGASTPWGAASTTFATDLDGSLIDSALLGNLNAAVIPTAILPPCLDPTTLTLTVTGLSTGATPSVTPNVTYAGWVGGSIAGLYQINANMTALPTAPLSALYNYNISVAVTGGTVLTGQVTSVFAYFK